MHDEFVLHCASPQQFIGQAVHIGRMFVRKAQVQPVNTLGQRRPFRKLMSVGERIEGHRVDSHVWTTSGKTVVLRRHCFRRTSGPGT